MLAIHGFYLLSIIGQPKGRVENSSNLGFENTSTLVTVGAYKYIRHPLYSSLLFGGWGVFFKDPSLLGGALAVAISAFLTATANVEEKENLRSFGSAYAEYMKTTKMFIPFLF
jgi:protein-S-isoprenylcysteine O-methyltransferase Ste14